MDSEIFCFPRFLPEELEALVDLTKRLGNIQFRPFVPFVEVRLEPIQESRECYELRRRFIIAVRRARDKQLREESQPVPRNPFDRLYENWGPENFAKLLEK